MQGLFRYDSVFIQLCTKAADAICLSLLWLLASLPVVTIGAATTALYYAVNKCIRRSESGVWNTFWQGFRQNFRQASGLWLLLLPLYGFLCACCWGTYLMCLAGNLPREMLWFLLAVLAAVTLWACFLFPYLARFQTGTRIILKNCLYIALMNLPVALLQLGLLLLSTAASAMFPFAILCAPGISMVLRCYALEGVFKKYMTEADRAKEEALDGQSV